MKKNLINKNIYAYRDLLGLAGIDGLKRIEDCPGPSLGAPQGTPLDILDILHCLEHSLVYDAYNEAQRTDSSIEKT